jgi:hypothetical protein
VGLYPCHQEKVLHVDMGFFPDIMLGKKSHVDMRFSHVKNLMSTWENLMSTWDFFPNIMFRKKTHVDFDMQKFHVTIVFGT